MSGGGKVTGRNRPRGITRLHEAKRRKVGDTVDGAEEARLEGQP
jgi:hypothetical protein